MFCKRHFQTRRHLRTVFRCVSTAACLYSASVPPKNIYKPCLSSLPQAKSPLPKFMRTPPHLRRSSKFHITPTRPTSPCIKKITLPADRKSFLILLLRYPVNLLNTILILLYHFCIFFRHFTQKTFFTYMCHNIPLFPYIRNVLSGLSH